MSDPVSVPQPPRPEPVVSAATVAGNVAGLVAALAAADATLAAFTHWPWAISSAALLGVVAAGLAKWMPLITATGARSQVTPLADPRAMDGSPLAPAPAAVSPLMGPDL